MCSGSESLFLGSHDGSVRIVSSTFKVLSAFQAHETGSITHMKQVEGTSLLVTISVCELRWSLGLLFGIVGLWNGLIWLI